MKIPKLLFFVAVAMLIACQQNNTEVTTDAEQLLKDSLKIASTIPQSTISFNNLKSSGTNLALSATASAQSTFSGYSPIKVNDGSTNVSVGGSYSWVNGHKYTTDGRLPQWFNLAFDSTITFSKINVFTTENYEIKQFKVLVNTNNGWDTIASVYNNDSVLVSLSFSSITADTIKILCEKGPDNQSVYTRLNEVQVY